jgi:general secretion pathway protein K
MTRRPHDTQGYILVTVLAVMILVSSLLAGTAVFVRSAINGARVADSSLVVDGLIAAGLDQTAYNLFFAKKTLVPGAHTHLRLATGLVDATSTDESSKIDLNGSDPQLLAALFESLGMGPGEINDLMARITEVRGPRPTNNTSPAAPGGTLQVTPTAPQAGAGNAALPFKRGFQSVGDLASFPELSRHDLEEITPLLTVYNPGGKINIRTASETVLALVPDLSGPRLAEILDHRGGATDKDLRALIGTSGAYLSASPGAAFTVGIDAIASSGQRRHLYAVIARSHDDHVPYYVLARWD